MKPQMNAAEIRHIRKFMGIPDTVPVEECRMPPYAYTISTASIRFGRARNTITRALRGCGGAEPSKLLRRRSDTQTCERPDPTVGKYRCPTCDSAMEGSGRLFTSQAQADECCWTDCPNCGRHIQLDDLNCNSRDKVVCRFCSDRIKLKLRKGTVTEDETERGKYFSGLWAAFSRR